MQVDYSSVTSHNKPRILLADDQGMVLEALRLLLKEVAPLSRNLSQCAETGLQALDYLSRGQRPPSGWAAQQMGMLQQALKPGHAQLLLMVAAPVESLVRASAGMSATASRNKRPWAVGGKR